MKCKEKTPRKVGWEYRGHVYKEISLPELHGKHKTEQQEAVTQLKSTRSN